MLRMLRTLTARDDEASHNLEGLACHYDTIGLKLRRRLDEIDVAIDRHMAELDRVMRSANRPAYIPSRRDCHGRHNER